MILKKLPGRDRPLSAGAKVQEFCRTLLYRPLPLFCWARLVKHPNFVDMIKTLGIIYFYFKGIFAWGGSAHTREGSPSQATRSQGRSLAIHAFGKNRLGFFSNETKLECQLLGEICVPVHCGPLRDSNLTQS